jgi:hypothetical protein
VNPETDHVGQRRATAIRLASNTIPCEASGYRQIRCERYLNPILF